MAEETELEIAPPDATPRRLKFWQWRKKVLGGKGKQDLTAHKIDILRKKREYLFTSEYGDYVARLYASAADEGDEDMAAGIGEQTGSSLPPRRAYPVVDDDHIESQENFPLEDEEEELYFLAPGEHVGCIGCSPLGTLDPATMWGSAFILTGILFLFRIIPI